MTLIRSIFKTIQNDPNTRNPVLWASWLVPMMVTPLARYASDRERGSDDRLGLSLEMFALYGIGTLLYFTFNPLTSVLTKRVFPRKSNNFHSLACGTTGSLVSALFSGFYSSRLGSWIKQKLNLSSEPDASAGNYRQNRNLNLLTEPAAFQSYPQFGNRVQGGTRSDFRPFQYAGMSPYGLPRI